MILVRLLALGILAHQFFCLCSDGKYYLTLCFLPTFGLTLTPVSRSILHITLIGLCLAILIRPEVWWLPVALLVVLSLIIASYYLRLSNHLVVAWAMTLLVCLDVLFRETPRGTEPAAFLIAGVQVIVVLTYFLSFLHKLNTEYLSTDQSCGASLAQLYLKDRRIENARIRRLFSLFAIYGTLALEAVLPILLLLPRTRLLGLSLAVVFQIQMGFLCHFHFSSIMYAGLAAFVPREMWPRLAALISQATLPQILIFLLIGMLFGWRFGIASIHRYRGAAVLIQMLFGVYSLFAIGVCIALFFIGPKPAFEWNRLGMSAWVTVGVIGLLFLVNGLGPYLGVKTEFSFAMFSNLRPEPWRHLLFPANWRPFNLASYVTVEEIDGLPERGQHSGGWATDIVLINLGQRNELKYSSYFFHEGLKLVSKSTIPPPTIRVAYVERGERHEVSDYARDPTVQRRSYLRATLFPFRLPIDPIVPYCS